MHAHPQHQPHPGEDKQQGWKVGAHAERGGGGGGALPSGEVIGQIIWEFVVASDPSAVNRGDMFSSIQDVFIGRNI